jgi:hypothetical protein
MATRKRIADLHARLTADVTQYDAEMKKAAAVTARTQQQVGATMQQMRRESTRLGLGLMGAGSAAILLSNHLRRTIADVDNIKGLDPAVVNSINSAKAGMEDFNNGIKRASATLASWAVQGAQNVGLFVGALIYGWEHVDEARRRMEEEGAAFARRAEEERLTAINQRIRDEREAIARIGESREDALAHERRLQQELADMQRAHARESEQFAKLELQRVQAKGRELRIMGDIAREAERGLRDAKSEADEFAKAMATMWSTVSDRAGQEFADMVITGRAAFGSLVDIAARAMLEIASRMAIINPLLNAVFGGFSGFTALPAFFKIPGFADGGRPQVGGLSVVGERGPEFFVPDRPGTILSAGQSAAALRGVQGGGVTINQVNNIGAGVSRAELLPALRQSQQEIFAALSDMQRRGAG